MVNYSYYSADYTEYKWKEVSENYVVKRVLKVCPDLNEDFVRYVLNRDGDGKYFDFEVADWVKYFKQKYYLKEVEKNGKTLL